MSIRWFLTCCALLLTIGATSSRAEERSWPDEALFRLTVGLPLPLGELDFVDRLTRVGFEAYPRIVGASTSAARCSS